jgi:phosphatidylserine/phosphatidylglycerophosphate/cardiolipin synthase-like enzyme
MNDLKNRKNGSAPILRPGGNCSCLAGADSVSFLIDADAYFRAFRSAAIKAEKSIYIEAWDIYSRERLMPEEPDDGYPVHLGDF